METRSAKYILEAPGGSCRRSERLRWVTSLGLLKSLRVYHLPVEGVNFLLVPVVGEGGGPPRTGLGAAGAVWRP